MNKEEKINKILKALYKSDIKLTGEEVYEFLKFFEIPENKENSNVKENIFNKWISRFKSKDTEVTIPEHENHFCLFEHGFIKTDSIKMYIPLDYEHLYEGANQIFDFLEENNINHSSKIANIIRNDNLVVRLNNEQEAKKLQEFIEKNEYIKEGLIPVNPFCINKNGVGYGYDNTVSYNQCLADALAYYINNMKENNATIEDINIKTFYNSLEEVQARPDILRTFEYADEKPTSLGSLYLATELIKLSLTTNSLEDYYNFTRQAISTNKRDLSNKLVNKAIEYQEKGKGR